MSEAPGRCESQTIISACRYARAGYRKERWMLDKPTVKSMLDTPVAARMPREIAPGVFWIGDCLAQRHKGKVYHGYNAAFLVAGEDGLDVWSRPGIRRIFRSSSGT